MVHSPYHAMFVSCLSFNAGNGTLTPNALRARMNSVSIHFHVFEVCGTFACPPQQSKAVCSLHCCLFTKLFSGSNGILG